MVHWCIGLAHVVGRVDYCQRHLVGASSDILCMECPPEFLKRSAVSFKERRLRGRRGVEVAREKKLRA